MTGFTSIGGDEECAISAPVLLYETVSSCLIDFKLCLNPFSPSSIGSSFTATLSWVVDECRSAPFVVWLRAVCVFPLWEKQPSCWVSLGGDVLGRFWKKLLKTLLLFWSFSLGVLHLTAEPGVFGDIGGESKCAFDNCCLGNKERYNVVKMCTADTIGQTDNQL